jgi:hypothetical protein
VRASLEALQSLRAAQQSLDRGRPDRSETLDKQWHEATTALKDRIINAIHRGRRQLVTTSDSAPKWISELADFEDIAGPRILAQNELSACWGDTLPDKIPAQPLQLQQPHTDAELDAARDAFQRRRGLPRPRLPRKRA